MKQNVTKTSRMNQNVTTADRCVPKFGFREKTNKKHMKQNVIKTNLNKQNVAKADRCIPKIGFREKTEKTYEAKRD